MSKSSWDKAVRWYNVDEVEIAIKIRLAKPTWALETIPTDASSRAFAVWLTHQYRVAMSKGIEIASEQVEQLKDENAELKQEIERLRELLKEVRSLLELQQVAGTHRTCNCQCCFEIRKAVGNE